VRLAVVLTLALAVRAGAQQDTSMANMPGMGNMPGMKMSGGTTMSMPIPMPPGMKMMPGFDGMTSPDAPFLPGAAVAATSLKEATPSADRALKTGDTLDLTAGLVRHQNYTMYGYNGQIPGPLLRVPQNANITVRFHNNIDLPSAVHWHGVRLDNANDGVPDLTQAPVAPGQSFTYHLKFPDAGIYWYHPHVREDIEQAMGLFGTILVTSPDPQYYSPANHEQVLMLSDLLINADTLIPFGKDGPTFTLMGRIGNALFVNGQRHYETHAAAGDVVRFFLVNASASRTYNLTFGDAPIKVVASDVSRFEHEVLVPSVIIAPAERYVVEVRFPHAGRYQLINAVQTINHYTGEYAAEVDTLGQVDVDPTPAKPDYTTQFTTLRHNADVAHDIDRYRAEFTRPPDKTFILTLQTNGLPLPTVQFMSIDTAYFAPVEWNDAMPEMNWLSDSRQVHWIIRDSASGKENMAIDWHVKRGSVIKLRIVNDPLSFHPMQHPIHLHGQRMLVLSRDGVPNPDLVWKDTALIPVGQTVDLLIDASNPGAWMLHCHIAEHLGTGMMTVLHVD
jgi:suppressor of ftsI